MGSIVGYAADCDVAILIRVRTGVLFFLIIIDTNGRYYGVIVPCTLNLITMTGFSILNSIVGGQALASVSSNDLSWT